MTFSRLFLPLLVITVSIAALAADKPDAAPEATQTQNPLSGSQSTAPTGSAVLVNSFIQDRGNSDLLGRKKAGSGSYSLSDLNGDVCYTMRSYKVKRTERLGDDQSGRRGYSTCEMASNYRIRSAEAKAKGTSDRH